MNLTDVISRNDKWNEFVEMLKRGESTEQCKKRMKRIKRLANEQFDLEDSIDVLEDYADCEEDFMRLEKKLKPITAIINI